MKNKAMIITGAFLEKDGKYLLCQQSEDKGQDAFKWGPATGKWDGDEDILMGAKREVKEETGYDFVPTSILGFYSRVREYPDVTQNVLRIVFRGNISGEAGNFAHDIIANKWFTEEEIMEMGDDMLRTPETKLMLQDFIAGKSIPLEAISFLELR